jgi:hypothetical protein
MSAMNLHYPVPPGPIGRWGDLRATWPKTGLPDDHILAGPGIYFVWQFTECLYVGRNCCSTPQSFPFRVGPAGFMVAIPA